MAAEKPIKILIAEDEPSMLSLVTRHVRSLGYTVVEAPDGDAAWELAQVHHPDLVILDVMMPGMSGWEVCKHLKMPTPDGEFAATGVIMLTGIGENLNEMTSPLFAADTWLNKPFDFADLEVKIHEVLDKYAEARVLAAAEHVQEEAPAHDEAEPAPAAHAEPKKPARKAAGKKKAAPKKAAKKKAASKKAASEKTAAKKTAKKGAAKKAPAKKPAAKKSAAKKTAKKKAARAK